MSEAKNNEGGQLRRPPDEAEREEENRQPSWVQKYLDLADLLMRHSPKSRENDDDKVA